MGHLGLLFDDMREGEYSRMMRRIQRQIIRVPSAFQRDHGKLHVMKERWDNLIILDACRYDVFRRIYREFLRGTLRKRRSLASTTTEWLSKNFTEKSDLIYISSNPFINNLGKEEEPWNQNFGSIIQLWDIKWEENLATVLPDDVIAKANSVGARNPGRRMIIHMMQPHLPYITKSKEFNRKVFEASVKGGMDKKILAQARKAYEDNLRAALKAIQKLDLPGRSVITADHGEAFGEFGVYLHHPGLYFSALIDVPWFVLENKGSSSSEKRAVASAVGGIRI